MNINKLNFQEHYDLITSSITNCDFIAFDCEFTGLRLNEEFTNYDSIEDLYQKSKQICQNFSLLQIGLTTFLWDPLKAIYIAKSFNFPLHKQSQFNSHSINYQFFQSESMSFLADQGFDFSETFLKGLSYERLANKEKLQEQVIKKPLYKFGFYLCDKSEKAKTRVFKQIEEFMQTPNKNKFEVDCETSFLARHLVKSCAIEKTLNLEKKLQISIKKTHPSVLKLLKIKQKVSPCKNNLSKTTPINQVSISEEKKPIEIELEEDKIEENKNSKIEDKNHIKEVDIKKTPKEIFFQEYGFSTIIEAIIISKKPMIGHFPILDLLFIYDSFIAELPENYISFVNEINRCFPCLLDTKLIAKSFDNIINIHSSLEELYYDVFEQEKALKPFHNVALDTNEVFDRYNSKIFHEAGFDSLVTGCVYIALNYFNIFLETGKDITQLNTIKSKAFTNDLCKKFENLLLCKTLKNYSLRPENLGGNIENNLYFMKNSLYFESNESLTIDSLGKIFGEFGDVNVTFASKTRNKGFVEYMTPPVDDAIAELQKIMEEIQKKQYGKLSIWLYKDRFRFKAQKIKNY